MTKVLDEIASKTMGAAKVVKATFKGFTGVFRKLTQEHGEVSALLIHVDKSDDPAVRAELFPKIRKELLAHEKAELAVVYPAFAQYSETRMIAEKHRQEAGELEKMIERLSAMPVQDNAWASTFDALLDLVKRHVDEEESEFFPAGERMLGAEADALQAQYEAAKRDVMAQLA
jgi:hemerythrin superfamily protein